MVLTRSTTTKLRVDEMVKRLKEIKMMIAYIGVDIGDECRSRREMKLNGGEEGASPWLWLLTFLSLLLLLLKSSKMIKRTKIMERR